jgi:hypothetical protein
MVKLEKSLTFCNYLINFVNIMTEPPPILSSFKKLYLYAAAYIGR